MTNAALREKSDGWERQRQEELTLHHPNEVNEPKSANQKVAVQVVYPDLFLLNPPPTDKIYKVCWRD